MQRRLNIGIGLLHQPRLLLLDEPTVGVDPQSRNAILESIAALGRQGMAILYTTHYMEEAERLCDRIGIIDGGEIRAEGTRKDSWRSSGAGAGAPGVTGDVLAAARAAALSAGSPRRPPRATSWRSSPPTPARAAPAARRRRGRRGARARRRDRPAGSRGGLPPPHRPRAARRRVARSAPHAHRPPGRAKDLRQRLRDRTALWSRSSLRWGSRSSSASCSPGVGFRAATWWPIWTAVSWDRAARGRHRLARGQRGLPGR